MTKEMIQAELDKIMGSSFARTSDKKLQSMEDLSRYQKHIFKGSQPPALIPYNSFRNRVCKLTPEKVNEIREKYRPNVYGKKRLAEEYGVSPSVILRILKNQSWRVG
jgi:hypothetical protein